MTSEPSFFRGGGREEVTLAHVGVGSFGAALSELPVNLDLQLQPIYMFTLNSTGSLLGRFPGSSRLRRGSDPREPTKIR